jgi:hypothetical protein
MIDAEVMRLRRLRNTALKARAVASALANSSGCDSVYSRSAIACWRIARVVTGTLRAHPYLPFQRGPGVLRIAYNALLSGATRRAAKNDARAHQACFEELQRVAHELDDARALTWSAVLSDTFGRYQDQVRRLLSELQLGARAGSGARVDITPRVALIPRVETRLAVVARSNGREVAENWPYLAF